MEEIDKNRLNWHGRYLDIDGVRYFDYSGAGFSFVFRGKEAVAEIVSDADDWVDSQKGVLGIFLWEGHEDSIENLPSKLTKKVILTENRSKITLFKSDCEKNVCISVIKLSECKYAYAGFAGLEVDGYVINNIGTGIWQEDKKLKLEFIGDSITCGYGIEGFNEGEFSTAEERPDLSYAFCAAKKLGAEIQCCSWSGIGILSHWIEENENLPDIGLVMGSNWPYTDKFLSQKMRIEPEVWTGTKFVPDVVVINLGTNDASYVRNVEERRLLFVEFYKQLMEAVHRRSPGAKILCCYGMMEQSLCDSVKEAVGKFSKDFPEVAEYLKLPLQLECDGLGTAGHPSEVTQKKVGEILAGVISSIKRS